jgi:photosystem II stability/assembly factor-like uncharacterized protein
MNNTLRILYILLIISQLACTSQQKLPTRNSLEERSAPYDHMSWQRVWPDTVFDWRAWRQTLRNAHLVAEARSSDCNSVANPTPWTLQGPSNVPGRVNTLAVQPGNEDVVLAGFSGGGIFKTTDAGLTWRPVFDNFEQLSIGDIAFSPTDPNIVYAGTGDVNMPSYLYNGDGVYRSTDAGETWSYFGLGHVGIISHIIPHPTDPNALWVASMGNPYQRNEERGVYRTIDGGLTWQKVLYVSNQAGCSGLVVTPGNPSVLYASFWDRIRNNQESVVFGPNAKIYKSINGGTTWSQLAGGLPTNNMGRTGLAVSPINPNKVYALYIDSLNTPGVLMVSTNAGTSWTSLNISGLETACADFGWYFGKIHINPTDDNDIYFHAIRLMRQNGPGAWQQAANGHADSHDLVFLPSGRRYWANDGGVVRYEPSNQTWIQCTNLPTTQVYRTTYNPHNPNEYWLGAQDNGIKRGNAAGLNAWSHVFTADGFRVLFHPEDPQNYTLETQNGGLSTTLNGGQTYTNTGAAFGTPDRVNWDAPILRSKYPPYTIYAGTYRLHSGPSPNALSAFTTDLTDGNIFGNRFHTISYLSESPITEGLLFVGTTDANVWRLPSPSSVPVNITGNLPNRYVTSVIGSPTVATRIFVTHSGFRANEQIPHIHRSDDNGVTWVNISGDLPQVPVNQLFILPDHQDSVLCAATDVGVFFTINGGTNWNPLGTGMPSIPVFDFALNPVRRELVAGTYARGIWTFPLDSILSQQGEPLVVTGRKVAFSNEQNLAVQHVEMPDLTSSTSNEQGQIALPELSACDSIVLRPQRLDDPKNGVTTYDLLLISRHLLVLEPLNTPYKIIAADANRSNTVTTFDIVTLRKVILGVDSVIMGNTSWRFVPKSHTFPNPNNPLAQPFPEQLKVLPTDNTEWEFTAIKVGDLNNSATPGLQSGEGEDRTVNICPLRVQDVAYQQDSIFDIPFYVEMSDLAAIQMALQWPADRLELLEVVPLALDMSVADNFNAQKNTLRMVWEQPAGAHPKGQPLFALRVRALRDGRLSSSLSIEQRLLPALAYAAQATQPWRPELVYQQPASNDVKVYPTLLTPQSDLQVEVPKDWSRAQISIFDPSGRMIHTASISSAVTSTVARSHFNVKGAYQVQVTAGDKRSVQSVIAQ